MKKILCLVLTMLLIGSLAACTVESQPADTAAATTATPAQTTAATTAATTAEPRGYTVTFVPDENVTVTVFETQDMTSGGTVTNSAVSRDSDTGKPTETDGQVNFLLTFAEGFELDGDIEITGTYNKLKGSADTETENGYRITKIAGDLTVTVKSRAIGSGTDDSENGFAVTFVTDENVTVTVYRTQDLSSGGTETATAASRDGATGAATKTDGQVNFVLSFAEGFELGSIQISGSYNKLKDPADENVENSYRITKVASDLTVTVTSKAKQ